MDFSLGTHCKVKTAPDVFGIFKTSELILPESLSVWRSLRP